MKTTLVIDDRVMNALKETAARERRTISELVESALRTFLERGVKPPGRLPPLPSFKMGKLKVNVANREELYEVMERR